MSDTFICKGCSSLTLNSLTTLPSIEPAFDQLVNLQVDEVQPLWMEMPQVVVFSNIVNSLKVISLTLHAYFELKSLDYGAITIEFANCLPTKFDGDIYLNLLLSIIHWDIIDNYKV
jgi:hypothetical protein